MDAGSGNGSSELEAESNNADSVEVILSSGETLQELDNVGKLISKIELDLACSSEKLVNLSVLKMHLETRENGFEAFAAEEQSINGCLDKASEFDLLSTFLDSEVRELGGLLSTLQMEIDYSHQLIPSLEDAGECCRMLKEKLYDSESLLKDLEAQLLELESQSSNFLRILSTSTVDGNRQDDERAFESIELAAPLTPNTKIKMETAEHQRHVLQMLEKSLANELDLEKKLSESKQSEEDLKHGLQQQLLCLEVELEDAYERLFEAENASQVLLGVSKEHRRRLQITQFQIDSALQREGDLKSKLTILSEQLSAKDNSLQKSENTCEELRKKVTSADNKLNDTDFCKQTATSSTERGFDMKVHEMEAKLKDLMENNARAERRAEVAEAECKSLKDANMKLYQDLITLGSSSSLTCERVCLLEKQLKESELNIQLAVASAEASQEKQTMLNITIQDMENVIEVLKSKVLEAESQIESAEEKCIILSEANADLNDELNLLKGRMKCLASSLHQAEETKKATARDISLHAKLITDLIMQLTLEREKLHKQISSLAKEKKASVMQSEGKETVPDALFVGDDEEYTGKFIPSKRDVLFAKSPKESGEAAELSFNNLDKQNEAMLNDEEDTLSVSKLGPTRDIDARQLKLSYFFIAALLIMVPALLAALYQHKSSKS
ncbi:unnamed protein product [Cuscuta epithymum]|uniref:WIT1/2 N-terminal helical bundle domain-containing protein n=1 Tax=Cuscuta epithymum TaxID=186058 RepID=A0AAV0CYK6_9ASTE|nr:unnamed protein product [Cuscuta epithymum]